jgi:uncharacterized protein (TIGR00725 family)
MTLDKPDLRLPIVGVMGSGTGSGGAAAADLGRLLARLGVHLLTGGGGGVMAAVSRAFHETPGRQGLVVGILPCVEGDPQCRPKPGYPNRWVELPIRTHLPLSGDFGTTAGSRNPINILTSDVIIALPGGAGTLSEIALAVHYGKPMAAFVPPGTVFPGLTPEVLVLQELDAVENFVQTWIETHVATGE